MVAQTSVIKRINERDFVMGLIEKLRGHSELCRMRACLGEDTPRYKDSVLQYNDLTTVDTFKIRQDCFDENMRASETDKCLAMIIRSFKDRPQGKRNS